ncbi:MAG: alkaline phosphatase D family protein [Bacteroidota bacterium]
MIFKCMATVWMLLPLALHSQYFGQSLHPMNKHTPNMEVLTYWKVVGASDTLIYKAALEVLSQDIEASYAELLGDPTYTALVDEHNKWILGGPMLGSVSSDQVSIWVRTARPSGVSIEYQSEAGEASRTEVSQTLVSTDLTTVIKLDDLQADQNYTYELIINDTLIVTNTNYRFRTPSDDNVRLVFGSCPHRWGLGNTQLFSTIINRQPNAMLFLGDIAVQDRDNHLGMHRADYLLRDFQSAWKLLASQVPICASWDDHDYFNNDRAGIPKGYQDLDRRNVRKIFQRSWVNPAYGENSEGIYFSTTIGSIDILMTDNRYFRTGEPGSFLGDTQMAWLKQQITQSESAFLVLSCGTMWSDFVSNGKDSWGVNDPNGRDEILDLLEAQGKAGVVLISGDRHGARGFIIERESGFQMHEFGAGSLGARLGPPKSKPEWTTQLYGIDKTAAFGELTFNSATDSTSVVFRLIREDGEVLYQKELAAK